MEKICSHCKIPKKLEDFYNDKSAKDGRKYECKECCKRYGCHWKTKEERNAHIARKRKENPTIFRANNKRYWEKLDPATKVWRQARGRAKRQGIEFTVEIADIKVPERCPLLNIPFIKGVKGDYMNTHSLDRIDNSKGYIKGNVQVLSMQANNMKSSATLEQLITFSKSIILQNKEHPLTKTFIEYLKQTI